jgi:hypothetical protein
MLNSCLQEYRRIERRALPKPRTRLAASLSQFNPTPTVRRSSVGLAVGASGRIPFRFRNSSLRQQVLHDVTMHIRQPKIAARMVICQAFVV